VFNEALQATAVHRLAVEQDLGAALDEGRLQLHYQPVVDLRDGRIVGMEALLRLVRPDGELVGPAAFIDVAEDSDLIVVIGAWVLQEACRQAAEWNERFGPLEMAVNISGRQAARLALLDQVTAAVDRSGLDPARLCLEMTERVLINTGDSVRRQFDDLVARGVHLAIDDFGTGYSSITYLKNFPIDTVKIDRAFVADLTRSRADAALVEAINGMAATLHLTTIAEGVETSEQLAHLRAMGCNRAQGYLLCRPQPPERISAVLADGLMVLP
jgi:EAL domain-containing protein (putative c-di-GMP-specific phosphodiesterase class I)